MKNKPIKNRLAIIHLMEISQFPLTQEYQTIYIDLKKKIKNLKIFLCYHANSTIKKAPSEQYNEIAYNNIEDLVEQLKKIEGEKIINTVVESLVPIMHELKKELGQAHTKDYQIFLDKNAEREKFSQAPQYIPRKKFYQSQQKLITNTIPNYPAIVKPAGGVGGRGVTKVDNEEQLKNAVKNLEKTFIALEKKNIFNRDFLIEEFIDGPQYVINYRVDEEQNYTLSVPTHVKTVQEIDIPDFANRARIIHQALYDELPMDRVHELIKMTINVCDIRNTYISHNFRIKKDGQLKTIELNGRMGGYRLEMNREAAQYNLFDPMCGIKPKQPVPILENQASISIWPHTEGILEQFNQQTIKTIKKLKSYHTIRLKDNFIDKKVGRAKNGFSTLGTIVLKNESPQNLIEDIEAIKKISNLLCTIKPNNQKMP